MIPFKLNPLGTSSSPYKRKLEYIESTGTQWLSTGIVFDKDYSMTAEAKCAIFSSANCCIAGNYSNGSEQSFNLQVGGSNGISPRAFIQLGASATATVTTLPSLSYNTPATLRLQYNASDMTATLSRDNGSTSSISVIAGSNTTKRVLNVFRDYRSNVFTKRFRIYWLKLYKSGVLCFDAVPVLDNNNVVCMYDSVSGACIYNQGTGTFDYN